MILVAFCCKIYEDFMKLLNENDSKRKGYGNNIIKETRGEMS